MATACVTSTEKFIEGDTNGRERDRSQVSGGKSERVLRARLLLSRVLVLCSGRFEVRWVRNGSIGSGLNRSISFVGCPAFPFIGQGKAQVTAEGKRRTREREPKSLRVAGSFFSFMRVLTAPCRGLVRHWCHAQVSSASHGAPLCPGRRRGEPTCLSVFI